VVKLEIDFHDRGVNSLDWSKDGTLLVSGSDDRTVRLWKFEGQTCPACQSFRSLARVPYSSKIWQHSPATTPACSRERARADSESKARPLRIMQGHVHNVSAVMFHPYADLVLSNSEDKTLRVWAPSKGTAVATFRRESDRYWCFAAHPRLNLLAAGHDGGLVVFKLGREKPPYTAYRNTIYMVKSTGSGGCGLYAYDLTSGTEACGCTTCSPRGLQGGHLPSKPCAILAPSPSVPSRCLPRVFRL